MSWRERAKPVEDTSSQSDWRSRAKPLGEMPASGPSFGERAGEVAASVGSGVKEFFTGGQGLAEQVPVLGPLGRMAGEGFRAVVEGGLKSDETIPQAWDRIRAENVAGDAKFAEQNPGADIAQKVVGGIGGAMALPIPGGSAPSVLSKIAGPAMKGIGGVGVPAAAGATGALARIAGTGGALVADTKLRGGDEKDVKRAATLGLGAQTAVEAIPYAGKVLGPLARSVKGGLSKVADKADEVAALRAVKAAFGNRDSAWKTVDGRVQEVGSKALDTGTVGFGDDAARIADKAKSGSKDAWGKVESVFKAADDAGVKIDAKEIADEILVAAQKVDPIGPGRSVAEALAKEAADIQKMGPISLAKAQELKNLFVHKVTDARTHALGLDGNNIMNRAFGNAIKGTVEKSGLKGADEFVDAYQTAGMLSGFGKQANAHARQIAKNQSFSLKDSILAGAAGTAAGAVTGDLRDAGLAGIAVSLANNLARTRGNAALAVSMRGLSNVLKTAPQSLGRSYQALEAAARTSPAAFAAAHEIMLQRDPEYRKAVTPDEPQPSAPAGMPIVPSNAIDRRMKRLGE